MTVWGTDLFLCDTAHQLGLCLPAGDQPTSDAPAKGPVQDTHAALGTEQQGEGQGFGSQGAGIEGLATDLLQQVVG